MQLGARSTCTPETSDQVGGRRAFEVLVGGGTLARAEVFPT